MTFQPSKYSLPSPAHGFPVLWNPKLSEKSCDSADADHKKYLKKMWDTPVLTQKRKDYEKKANAAHKLSMQCKKAGVGGREKGYPSMSVPKLWQSDPKKRPVEAGLVVSAVLGGPEILDIVTAATKGWNPTVAIALEWRAEIAAGLLTLQMLGEKGYESIDANALQKLVALTLSKKDNTKLLKMAGSKGNNDSALRDAARKMRARVAKLGDAAMTYAFGTRGLLMCSAGSVAQALQSTVKTGVLTGLAFVPVFGTAAAAIGGGIEAAKSAVASSLAAAAKKHMQGLVDQASQNIAAEADKKVAEAELKTAQALEKVQKDQAAALDRLAVKTSAPTPAKTSTFFQSGTLLWSGVAVVALTGLVLVARSRSSE